MTFLDTLNYPVLILIGDLLELLLKCFEKLHLSLKDCIISGKRAYLHIMLRYIRIMLNFVKHNA